MHASEMAITISCLVKLYGRFGNFVKTPSRNFLASEKPLSQMRMCGQQLPPKAPLEGKRVVTE